MSFMGSGWRLLTLRAQRTQGVEDPLSIYTAILDYLIHDTLWISAQSHSSLHKS